MDLCPEFGATFDQVHDHRGIGEGRDVAEVVGLLGGDLALPAALLTDTLRQRGEATRAAGYFGVWTFATKMSAAAAAGVGLPLIEALGDLPGRPETAFALQAVYCLLPCALKIVAACIVPVSVRTGTQGVLP